MEEKNTSIAFEEYDDSHRADFDRVQQLRAQLAVVDRAIGLVGTFMEEGASSLGSKGPQKINNRSSQSSDQSFQIDLMSHQLATCPQCLEEMDVKKLKSHTANTCPNKLIVCPEPSCGCQMSLKHLRRHLSMECEVAGRRRKLVSDAEQRRLQEALRKKEEAALRRRDREHNLALTSSETMTTGLTDHHPPPSPVAEESGGDGGDGLDSRHTTCPKCGESMRQSQLSTHQEKQCSRRRVMCPNYHNGCKQRLVPLFLLQTHLRSECAAEKHKDRMIAKAAQRRELMKCPACGMMVPLIYLRKHERELCSNRRVRCRNHALGCGVMVRLKDRAQHERVDTSKAVRSALYLPGHGAHLAVGEDDVPCPWTAEYWIYRPTAKESLKMHLRNLVLLLPKYGVAFAAEVCVKNQVMRIVKALNSSAAANDATAAADAGKLSKEQRAQRARELTAQRMGLINALTALVPLYTECVLAYTHAFQELAVSVEAGYLCALEVTSEIGFRDTERVSLVIEYPGSVSAKPSSQFSFVGEGSRTTAKGRAAGSEQGSSCGSSVGSDSSTGKRSEGGDGSSVGSLRSKRSSYSGISKSAEKSRGGPVGEDDDGGGEEDDLLLSADEQEFDELLLGDYEDYIAQQGQDGEGGDLDEEEGGCDSEGSEGSEGAAGGEDQAEEGGIHSEGVEGSEYSGSIAGESSVSSATGKSSSEARSKASRAAAAALKARRSVQIDFDSVAAYTMNGSTVASLLKACLHLENEEAFYLNERNIAGYSSALLNATEVDEEIDDDGEGDAHRGGSMLLHPDLDLAYLLPEPSTRRSREGEGGGDEGEEADAVSTTSSARSRPSPVMADSAPLFLIPPERVSKAMLDLRAQGVSGFLADLLLAPRRASRARTLSWCSWRSLLEVLRSALKNDFDALQTWRIESGLLKPDSSKAGGTGGKASMTHKQEKALEKKEKARLKREMKKQGKLHNDGEPPVTAAESGPAASIATVVGGGKKEESLFKRMGELLKAGCGTGVLAESSSTSKSESVRTRVCLSLGSGLSLLRSSGGVEDSKDRRSASPLSLGTSIAGAGLGEGNGPDGEHGEEGEESFQAEGEEDHHYDLLIRPQELSRLMKNSGKIGIVTIPQTVGELTGMGDAQLQAQAREQEERDELALSGLGSTSALAGSSSSKSGKLMRRKKASSGAIGAGSASTAKKAGSLVRLGVEARSFEVSVPRGKWTHIALVATALPNNKLTLYMDGLMVKTLKDCAFPLPMSALGGSAQTFESFEGALLDVRYWNVQRSSVEIIDNMHKLLDLDTDASATGGSGGSSSSSSSSSQGLVGWWTFEDGGGMASAADVTGHRFKTLIHRRQNAVPKRGSTANKEVRAVSPSNPARASSAAGEERPSEGGKENTSRQVEGLFTSEERTRYCIPEEVRGLLPVPYHKLLPPAPESVIFSHVEAPVEKSSEGTVPPAPPRIDPGKTPWAAWMASLPRWNWLEAESLPTPKAVVLPPSLLARHEPPHLPTKKRSDAGKTHPVPPHSAGSTVPKASTSKQHAPSENRSVLPVPSLRARGICPYELRRHRLATAGRELQREVDCPLGCEDKVKMVEMRFHVRFVCQRRLVSCRFDFCHASFPVGQRENHERTECQNMYARRKVLSKAELHTTLFPCVLCSENIMQRDMAAHQLQECAHRLVTCPHRDCGLGRGPCIQAHLLQHHLQFDCDSPTRKERFMLVERARERVKYPRPWGITISLSEEEQHHQEEVPAAVSSTVMDDEPTVGSEYEEASQAEETLNT